MNNQFTEGNKNSLSNKECSSLEIKDKMMTEI